MNAQADALPSLSDAIEVADFDDEIVVLVAKDRRAVHLTAGPAIVFDSCRRGHAATQLLDEIVEATRTDRAAAAIWIHGTLQEFVRLGFLTPSSQGVAPSEP